ncbi:hypothetical protein GGQ97_002646 [Sphingomonas kaistensis]|uniref:Uncharacterized protein n=1 Tax=Sphingomonas kaistensis TaxID=298708 RepID=A0A7X5Y7Z5_9SPHN|nr:hypothetical protein [Sphingomonas kaistensis]
MRAMLMHLQEDLRRESIDTPSQGDLVSPRGN